MADKTVEDYLMHRSYKYIDKYKSKAGKWVYVYKRNTKNFIDTKITGKKYLQDEEAYRSKAESQKKDSDYAKRMASKYGKLSDASKKSSESYLSKANASKTDAGYYKGLSELATKQYAKTGDWETYKEQQSKITSKMEDSKKAADQNQARADYELKVSNIYAKKQGESTLESAYNAKRSEANTKLANEANSNYKTKSLAGLSETAINKGKEFLNKILGK